MLNFPHTKLFNVLIIVVSLAFCIFFFNAIGQFFKNALIVRNVLYCSGRIKGAR